MLVPIPYVHAGIGLVMALTSIPLILRRVPMNHYYGIRIRKSLASAENWYTLNAFAGKLVLLYGMLLLVFGIMTQTVAPAPSSLWAPVFLLVPLVGLVLVFLLIVFYARGLPES